jgi:hypothetical protein
MEGGRLMPNQTKAQSFKLSYEEIPERKSIYAQIIEEFLTSGKESARVDGELAEKAKTGTIVTSLTTAKRGKPVKVRRIRDEKGREQVWLQRKPMTGK